MQANQQVEKAQIFFKDTSQQGATSGQERLDEIRNALKSLDTIRQKLTKEKIFQVQFNPDQLSYQAQNRAKKKKSVLGKPSENQQTIQDPTVSLTVKLLFAKGEDDQPSVQQEIELFLSAARNPNTREIVFGWSQFVFIGKLANLDVSYTMFTPEGKPIRGEIDLTIQKKSEGGYFGAKGAALPQA
jgi:hypothetical protein